MKLVIFDLDGTLIDSSYAIIDCFNLMLQNVGEPRCPEEKIRKMIGKPLEDMYREILPKEKHHLIEEIFSKYVERFSEIAPKTSILLEGVEPMLIDLKKKGMMIALATTKYSHEAEKILKELGVLGYFDMIAGSDQVKKPKPDPEIINLVLSSLAVSNNSAMMVGDTFYDIKAGKAAKVKTVAVTTGTETKEQLKKHEPDYIIDNIEKLLNLV